MRTTRLEHLLGVRWALGRYGSDPCDECDINEVLGLPEGLTYLQGRVQYQCRVCEEWTELPVDPNEYDHGHPHNVCGRSPSCCP